MSTVKGSVHNEATAVPMVASRQHPRWVWGVLVSPTGRRAGDCVCWSTGACCRLRLAARGRPHRALAGDGACYGIIGSDVGLRGSPFCRAWQ
jgi:hypothetical protein